MSFSEQNVYNQVEKFYLEQDKLLNELHTLLYSNQPVDSKYLKHQRIDYVNSLKMKIRDWIEDIDDRFYLIRVLTPDVVTVDSTSTSNVMNITIESLHAFTLLTQNSLRYDVQYNIYDDNGLKIYSNKVTSTTKNLSLLIPNVHLVYGGKIELVVTITQTEFDYTSRPIRKVVPIVSQNQYPNDSITITEIFRTGHIFNGTIYFEVTGFQEMFPELNLLAVECDKPDVNIELSTTTKEHDKILASIEITTMSTLYSEIPLKFIFADTQGYTIKIYNLLTGDIFEVLTKNGIYCRYGYNFCIVHEQNAHILTQKDIQTISNKNILLVDDNIKVYLDRDNLMCIIDNIIYEKNLPFTIAPNQPVLHKVYNNALYIVSNFSVIKISFSNKNIEYNTYSVPLNNDVVRLDNISIKNNVLYISVYDYDNQVLRIIKYDIITMNLIDSKEIQFINNVCVDFDKNIILTSNDIRSIQDPDHIIKQLPYQLDTIESYINNVILGKSGNIYTALNFNEQLSSTLQVSFSNILSDVKWVNINKGQISSILQFLDSSYTFYHIPMYANPDGIIILPNNQYIHVESNILY